MHPETAVAAFNFEATAEIPNHPTLPLVIIKQAIDPAGGDLAEAFEKRYSQGGWRAAWRWGVYDFPHYHSTAHEVLGCYRGSARIRFGHTAGTTVDFNAGDAVVIPAGVGHENLGSTDDFHVVGGYPVGQDADLLRADPGKLQQAVENIVRVPPPGGDPIFGSTGPLREHWRL